MKRGATIAQMKCTSINAVLAFVFALAGLVLVLTFEPSRVKLYFSTITVALTFTLAAFIEIAQSKGRLTGRGFAVAGLLITVAALLFYPAVQRGWVKIQMVSCKENIEEIGKALALYAKDHNGKYPPKKWQDAIHPYVKDEKIFRCPNYKGHTPTYAMNAALAGRSIGSIKDPHNTILLFESVPVMNLADGSEFLPEEPRHDMCNTVLFADGTTKCCCSSEVRELMRRAGR